MDRKAIYAVSGDPWTKGHTDIVRRALQIFDLVIVAIGNNPKKNYSFSVELRKRLAEVSLIEFMDRIEVVAFEGLLVDFAYMRDVKTLIRGIRDDIDFNFEKSMFQVNITQKGIDEIFLFPSPQYEHISSSAVRELQQNQGNITDYVDLRVKQAMEHHLSNQRIIGVTGMIGAGKTYIAKKLCDLGKKLYKMDFHNIELDDIGRNLLKKDTRPFALKMRQSLVDTLDGGSVLILNDPENTYEHNCFLDVRKLSSKIFNSQKDLVIYNLISTKPILFEMQQQLLKKTGVIFLNSALLIEAGITSMCNNNVLFITADDEFRVNNLKERGYVGNDLDGRLSGQLSGENKLDIFRKVIGDDWGQLLSINNSPSLTDMDLMVVLQQIMDLTECI